MKVVVTGANRGIGAALAGHYRDAGHDVIGTSRGGENGLASLDVTSDASLDAFANSLGADPVDQLICNAGVYRDKGVSDLNDYSRQMWADSFDANVTGVFMSIRAVMPMLEKAKAPKIAIISSIMASSTRAPGGAYAYRASKAAVANLGCNLAKDLAGSGIAVGIYHPGWVRTDMGGAGADIDAETSVAGLTARFEALSLASSGEFLAYDGQEIPF